jgi:hypothetical protein
MSAVVPTLRDCRCEAEMSGLPDRERGDIRASITPSVARVDRLDEGYLRDALRLVYMYNLSLGSMSTPTLGESIQT